MSRAAPVMLVLLATSCFLPVAGCSSSPPAGELVLQEAKEGIVKTADTITISWIPVTEADAGTAAGAPQEIGRFSATSGTYSLGTFSTASTGALRIDGFSGPKQVLYGRTPALVASDLVSKSLSIAVFPRATWMPFAASRVGDASFSLSVKWMQPVGDRYLLLTSSDSIEYALLDLSDQSIRTSSKSFPFLPLSMGVLGRFAIPVGKSEARLVDLSNGEATSLSISQADLEAASGGTFVTGKSAAVLVGATREAGSDSVLRFNADASVVRGKGSFRKGAKAVWIDGLGTVVIGGSETLPLMEVIPDQGSSFPLPFAFEPSAVQSVALRPGSRTIVTLSATGRVATYDLNCTGATCVPGVLRTEAAIDPDAFVFFSESGVVGLVEPVKGMSRLYKDGVESTVTYDFSGGVSAHAAIDERLFAWSASGASLLVP